MHYLINHYQEKFKGDIVRIKFILRKPSLILLFGGTIVIFFLIGCDKTKEDWENAKFENSIESYQEFINKYSEGIFSDSARIILEQKYFEKAKFTNTVDACKEYLNLYPTGNYYKEINLRLKLREPIKIILDEYYGKDSLTIKTNLEKFLDRAGFKPIFSGDKNHISVLRIKIRGRPKGSYYTGQWGNIILPSSSPFLKGPPFLYIGAKVNGIIELETYEKQKFVDNFSSLILPPSKIIDTLETYWSLQDYPDKPRYAPFDKALQKSCFLFKIIMLFNKAYGEEFLNLILKEYNENDWGNFRSLRWLGDIHLFIDDSLNNALINKVDKN